MSRNTDMPSAERPSASPTAPLAEWLLAGLIFLAATLLTAYFQKPLTFNSGKGWDGSHYYGMAEGFAMGDRPAAAAPFVNRLAAPFLAAKVAPKI